MTREKVFQLEGPDVRTHPLFPTFNLFDISGAMADALEKSCLLNNVAYDEIPREEESYLPSVVRNGQVLPPTLALSAIYALALSEARG